MSNMSEVHGDLATIHAILLGQRQVAQVNNQKVINNEGPFASEYWSAVVECIDNLLLEFEAAGVVWPGNVVEIEPQVMTAKRPIKLHKDVDPTTPDILGTYCTRCNNGNRVEICGCSNVVEGDFSKCWPKEL